MLNFLFRSVLNAPQVSSSLNILQIRGVVCLVLIEMPLTSNSSQMAPLKLGHRMRYSLKRVDSSSVLLLVGLRSF